MFLIKRLHDDGGSGCDVVMYTASAEDAALEVAGPKEVSPCRLSVGSSAYAIMN